MGATEIEPTYFYSFYSFRQMNFNKWNVLWSLCFGLLSFLIIVGNALSISILFKRRLRKRPYFLLISLAFADLLVGLIPVPLYIIIQYSRYRIFGLVYIRGDMFAVWWLFPWKDYTQLLALFAIDNSLYAAMRWP